MTSMNLYQAGLVVTALFGAGHFLGFLQAANAARHDPEMEDLTRAMRTRTVKVLGFEASLLDFREYFSLNFSLLLWLAAAVGWLATDQAADPAATARVLAPVYGLGMLVLLGTSLVYRVAQGVLAGGLLVVLFGLAWYIA